MNHGWRLWKQLLIRQKMEAVGQDCLLQTEPETVRKTKPGYKRLFLSLSVLLSFLLGFPILLKSVEIYRARLPFDEIDALHKAMNADAPFFSYHFHVLFINSNHSPDFIGSTHDVQIALHNRMVELTSKLGQHGAFSDNFNISVDSCSKSCFNCHSLCTIDFELGDNELDDAIMRFGPHVHPSSFGGSVYTMLVIGGKDTKEQKTVVGKYRHAWIFQKVPELDTLLEDIVEVFVKMFMNGGRDGLLLPEEFTPVGADGRIVLSFNLLNANSHDWIYDWDFQVDGEMHFQPVLEALESIATTSLESQVVFQLPKSHFSSWDAISGNYIISSMDILNFINSSVWPLDTSMSAGGGSKILQFVVYIPSADECPLLIQHYDGIISATRSFMSQSWGGVMIWNPQRCSIDSYNGDNLMHVLPHEELEKIFEVFMGQIRRVFGLNSKISHVGSKHTYIHLNSVTGFTEWERDVLLRHHTTFNLRSTVTALKSLSNLVNSMSRMIVLDEIERQVILSIKAVKFSLEHAHRGQYYSSAVFSKKARASSDEAAFHPSLMSRSYYSFEHCFAIYSPFFVPVGMHVILAASKEWKRYTQRKAKYISWMS